MFYQVNNVTFLLREYLGFVNSVAGLKSPEFKANILFRTERSDCPNLKLYKKLSIKIASKDETDWQSIETFINLTNFSGLQLSNLVANRAI